MFVQFSDATEKVIVAVFASGQDIGRFPNQGQIEASDARYARFFDSLPSFIQETMPPPEQTTSL